MLRLVQWRVIVLTFVLASMIQFGHAIDLYMLVFWVVLIAGGLGIWFLENKRSK